jgi:hypothetical protein
VRRKHLRAKDCSQRPNDCALGTDTRHAQAYAMINEACQAALEVSAGLSDTWLAFDWRVQELDKSGLWLRHGLHESDIFSLFEVRTQLAELLSF